MGSKKRIGLILGVGIPLVLVLGLGSAYALSGPPGFDFLGNEKPTERKVILQVPPSDEIKKLGLIRIQTLKFRIDKPWSEMKKAAGDELTEENGWFQGFEEEYDDKKAMSYTTGASIVDTSSVSLYVEVEMCEPLKDSPTCITIEEQRVNTPHLQIGDTIRKTLGQ